MSNTSTTEGTAIMAEFSILFVWVAVLIFAAANSIVLMLFELGRAHPIDGCNAISFSNVLFVGNLCACLTLIAVYRRHWTRENLNALTLSDWLSLGILAILTGAILPSVIFYALLNTTVINVVLVGRIEPFVLLAPSPFFLKEKTNKWAVIGASICLAGVVTSFVLEGLNSGFSVGRGETAAALGAVLAAVGIIVSKVRLRSIPLGIFSVIRTGFGDVFFFIFAIYLFGIDQFEHAFSPFLWQLMVFYGAVIVVGGQYFWFTGIKNAPKSDVSLASSFTPIAAAGFAFLFLGERPGSSATVYHGRSLSVACRQPRLYRPSVGSTSRAFDHPPF